METAVAAKNCFFLNGVWVKNNINILEIQHLNAELRKVAKSVRNGDTLIHTDAMAELYPSIGVQNMELGETREFGERLKVRKLSSKILMVFGG